MVPTILVVSGVTAGGKSTLAEQWCAADPRLEMISADSLTVYRQFDIGSAKPSKTSQKNFRYHLIDRHDPNDGFTAADFRDGALAAIEDIHARGKRALVVGGTGFYIKALTKGLWKTPDPDPELRADLEKCGTPELFEKLQKVDPNHATKIGPSDRYRMIRALEIIEATGTLPSRLEEGMKDKLHDERFSVAFVDRPQDILEKRLRERIRQMLDDGWIEETERLREGYPGARGLAAIGYQQIIDWLDKRVPRGRKLAPGRQGLEDEIYLAHRRLAKAQRTWFRSQVPARFFTLDRDLADLEKLKHDIFRS